MKHRIFYAVALISLIATAACQPDLPPEPTALSATPALASPAAPSVVNLFEAAKYLPPQTVYLGVFDGIRPGAERLGYATLMAKYAQYTNEAIREVEGQFGHNLFDVNVLQQLGIDVDKPFGFAWVSLENETGTLFGQVTNMDTFKATLELFASKSALTLKPDSFGRGNVLCFESGPEICFALRDPYVFMTFSDDGREHALTLAQYLITPSVDSLEQSKIFKDTLALPQGGHFSGFCDVGAIYSHEKQRSAKYADESLERTKTALEEAKISGDAEEISRLEEELRWEQQRADRRKAEDTLWENLLTSSYFTYGVEIVDNSIQITVQTPIRTGSLLSQLVQNQPSPFAIQRTLAEPPLFFAAAKVDPQVALKLITLLAAAEGESIETFKIELKKELNLELDQLLSAFNGEIGIAVTGNLQEIALAPTHDDIEKAFGGAIVVGLNQPDVLRGIIETVATKPKVSALLSKDPTTNFYLLNTPWRPVHFAISDQYFIAATDPESLRRISDPSLDFTSRFNHKPLRQLFSATQQAAVFDLDQRLFYTTFISQSSSYYDGVEEATSASDTPEIAEKREKLKEIRKEMRTLREQKRQRENTILLDIFSDLGHMAARLETSDKAFTYHGGFYFNAPTFEQWVATLLEKSINMAEIDNDPKLDVLYQQESELENAIYQLQYPQ